MDAPWIRDIFFHNCMLPVQLPNWKKIYLSRVKSPTFFFFFVIFQRPSFHQIWLFIRPKFISTHWNKSSLNAFSICTFQSKRTKAKRWFSSQLRPNGGESDVKKWLFALDSSFCLNHNFLAVICFECLKLYAHTWYQCVCVCDSFGQLYYLKCLQHVWKRSFTVLFWSSNVFSPLSIFRKIFEHFVCETNFSFRFHWFEEKRPNHR